MEACCYIYGANVFLLHSGKILYMVLMFFYCTVAFMLMLNECENVSQRMETAAMQHTPFFYLYTIPRYHRN